MAGSQWLIEVGGYPCTIERDQSGWVATFAATTVGRAATLDTAIIRACGDLITAADAAAMAASLTKRHRSNAQA